MWGLATVADTLDVAEDKDNSDGLRIPSLPKNDLVVGGLTACCEVPGIASRIPRGPPGPTTPPVRTEEGATGRVIDFV